jgi:pilin/secretion family protein with methylation motif
MPSRQFDEKPMSGGLGVDRKRSLRRAGFTLVALLAAIAVIGILEDVPVRRNGWLALVGG